MKAELEYYEGAERLLNAVSPVETEAVPLEKAAGRVLAKALTALEDVPPFDRSPYDGYAFRAADVCNAAKEHPVTLRVLEEIAAGAVGSQPVTEGTAVKILTGAAIPAGADCVEMFEKTEFTPESVTLFAPLKNGENIIRRGEDVTAGAILAEVGSVIDPGLAGTLAAQGETMPLCYRRPQFGLISTGSELVEPEQEPGPGKIRNSNRYTLTAALTALGCETEYYGIAADSETAIADWIEKALGECDGVILTGGVSVGDYDRTPAAMEKAGCELLFRHVKLKPGGACCYGVRDGKPVIALSGNPASSATNFYAVAAPALRKMAGRREQWPREITVTLAGDFGKKSGMTRLLRGRLDYSGEEIRLIVPDDQGNVVIRSMIGTEAMAIVPAGSGKLPAGTKLKGFLL